LFLAHQWSEAIGQRFLRLRREIGPSADCFVRLHDHRLDVLQRWTDFVHAIGAPEALVPFDAGELPAQLGLCYFSDRRIMGNTHFPLLQFARSAAYRYYWQVESDVEYRGNWLSFISSYTDCDAPLLASHVYRYHERPTWTWWLSLSAPPAAALKQSELCKAFFPVFRISNDAIEAVEQAHRSGWLGHFEALVPTAVVRAGLRVQDLASINPCYVGPSQDPCTLEPLSTLRWRPKVSRDEFEQRGDAPTIFHPVKDNWSFDGEKVLQFGSSE
jgi:hypothetical protein